MVAFWIIEFTSVENVCVYEFALNRGLKNTSVSTTFPLGWYMFEICILFLNRWANKLQ